MTTRALRPSTLGGCMMGSGKLAVIAIVLAAVSMAASMFTLTRVGVLVKAHIALVEALNQERLGSEAPPSMVNADEVPDDMRLTPRK